MVPKCDGDKMGETVHITRLRMVHAAVNKTITILRSYFALLCIKCTSGAIETIEQVNLNCPQYEYLKSTSNK